MSNNKDNYTVSEKQARALLESLNIEPDGFLYDNENWRHWKSSERIFLYNYGSLRHYIQLAVNQKWEKAKKL